MKPILFNTEMVRAILDGRKTVTRRVVKPQPPGDARPWVGNGLITGQGQDITLWLFSLPYAPGDILWVRETWQFIPCIDCNHDVNGLCHDTPITYENADSISDGCFVYRADYPEPQKIAWKPSTNMPKEAARIFLRVADIRIERLQDITGNEAVKEGAEKLPCKKWAEQDTVRAFAEMWDKAVPRHPNKFKRYPYYWRDNPWVWVIEFERCEKPEEAEDG